ncbi:restriction endonuclease-like protein [Lederbergia citrea]|uniref:restriction endonuclease-like protein n=1 Tax=Lederbergia citrea TaxID=2833581 RepID=UPI00201612A1|nr:restriction endonuclease-like protein [Lederbergia citrea]
MNPFKETKELLLIETQDFSLYIKGVPYNQQYESLLQYRFRAGLEKEMMMFRYEANNLESIELYDIETNQLIPIKQNDFAPIFFENRIYQLVITPKTERELSFYHEHPGIREAVTSVGKSPNQLLMGNLQFMNEVGLTSFYIYSGHEKLLEIKMEIFPSKLNYKEDYRQLLEEVNEEIYNLAFHFIKKTYLGASSVFSDKPSPVEFFRLLEHYFHSFCQAIDRIEAQPHHVLITEYERVRGDRIKRLDAKGKRYLRKNVHLFQQADSGIESNHQLVLPIKGLNAKKTQSFDTNENRFVKWMMERLIHQLIDLKKKLLTRNSMYDQTIDEILVDRIRMMIFKLESYLKKPFWMRLGSIDRSVLNMVMQLKIGYRDAYKIYLIVTRGLALQGEMFKMSVKDVATLYEYWTYLKVGQILRNKYEAVDQNIVKVTQGRLFVNLDQTREAKQVFRHQQTGEKITLSFQKSTGKLPTVKQKPDIMLEIEKSGKDYSYNYIFDAKYRIDFSQDNPGPLEEDINTMHRYRDAHVVKQNGPYERHAFGAYVLFPWQDEDNYELHPFYESIDEVNIGGLPFLPRTTKLVERLVERLVESNPEELQQEGILPRGSISFWESQMEEVAIIGSVNNIHDYHKYKKNGFYEIQASLLNGEWQKSKYLALYTTQNVAKMSGAENGIQFYGEISRVEIIENLESEPQVRFYIHHWQTFKQTIRPVGYGIQTFIMTSFNVLSHAKDLPELFMKSGEEVKLWRMLRRLTTNVQTTLDDTIVDRARKIQAYQIGYYFVVMDPMHEEIHVMQGDEILEKMALETLRRQPSHVFKVIKETIFE